MMSCFEVISAWHKLQVNVTFFTIDMPFFLQCSLACISLLLFCHHSWAFGPPYHTVSLARVLLPELGGMVLSLQPVLETYMVCLILCALMASALSLDTGQCLLKFILRSRISFLFFLFFFFGGRPSCPLFQTHFCSVETDTLTQQINTTHCLIIQFNHM